MNKSPLFYFFSFFFCIFPQSAFSLSWQEIRWWLFKKVILKGVYSFYFEFPSKVIEAANENKVIQINQEEWKILQEEARKNKEIFERPWYSWFFIKKAQKHQDSYGCNGSGGFQKCEECTYTYREQGICKICIQKNNWLKYAKGLLIISETQIQIPNEDYNKNLIKVSEKDLVKLTTFLTYHSCPNQSG